MNGIIIKKSFSEDLVKFEIKTSIVLNNIQPGQYIILRTDENEPGIPLPVVKTNAEKESVTVIVSAIDESNRQMSELIVGSTLFGIEGPFGYPALIENFGTVLCVGRGPGIIALLPVLNSLRVAKNRIVTILSACSKDEILLKDEIKAISDEVITITDEGSCGEKISICQAVGQVLRNNRISQVFVIGTAKTIKETCSHATKNNIRVQAILHIGRTVEHGAHGIFRVSSCGSGRSVCVDGFSFNAYYLNFEEMIKRFGSEEFDMTGKLKAPNKENIPV